VHNADVAVEAPTLLSANSSSVSLELSWSVPAQYTTTSPTVTLCGSLQPITLFELEMFTNGSTLLYRGADTKFTVLGLSPGTNYDFRLRGGSALGYTGWSPTARHMTRTETRTEDKNLLPLGAVAVTWAITGVLIISSLSLGVWTLKLASEGNKLIKASQPLFMMILVFGTVLSLASAYPMALDDQQASVNEEVANGERGRFPLLDWMCNVQWYLVILGFASSYGALFVKVEKISLLCAMTEYFLTPAMVFRFQLKTYLKVSAIVLSQLAVLIAMSISAPLFWMRMVDSRELDGFVSKSHGACVAINDREMIFVYVLALFQILLLIYGLALTFRVRKAPSQYAETKYIFFALATQLQFKFFFLMLSVNMHYQRLLWYLLKWFTVIVTDAGTLFLIFLPKVRLLRKHKDGKMGTAKNNFLMMAIKRIGSNISDQMGTRKSMLRTSDRPRVSGASGRNSEAVLDSGRVAESGRDERGGAVVPADDRTMMACGI